MCAAITSLVEPTLTPTKRPKIVSFVAGYLIVCSLIGSLVFIAVIPRVDTIQTSGEQARWIVDHLGRGGLLAVTLIVYLLAGSTGVGLWRLRSWGRLSMLLASAALVGISVVVGTVTAVRQHEFDLNALIIAVVFGWPLYYFNRAKIKALFA
jgi:hypothetical protein